METGRRNALAPSGRYGPGGNWIHKSAAASGLSWRWSLWIIFHWTGGQLLGGGGDEKRRDGDGIQGASKRSGSRSGVPLEIRSDVMVLWRKVCVVYFYLFFCV